MPTRTLPLDDRHLDRILTWLQDQDLRDHIGTVYPISRPQHLEWYRTVTSDRSRLVMAIESDEAGGHVGMIGMNGIDLVYRSAELWIYLGDPAARGMGVAQAAFEQVVRFGFDTIGLNRIFVQVFGFNERAQRFFQACGMRHEGTLRDAVFKRGRFHDKLVYGLLAREFSGR